MKKVVPIILLVLSIAALGVTGFALTVTIESLLVAESLAAGIGAAIAIIFIMIGFFASVIIGAVSFIFTKSKICLASGIICALSIIINIVSFLLIAP